MLNQRCRGVCVHAFDFASAGAEVTGIAPLIAERATQITRLRGNELDHCGRGQFETSVAHRLLKLSAPTLLASPPAPVKPGEVQIVLCCVAMLHLESVTIKRTVNVIMSASRANGWLRVWAARVSSLPSVQTSAPDWSC